MSRNVKVRKAIVRYSGSMADMHGFWRVECGGARLTLRSAYGLKLVNVRHASVQAVEVPTFTPARADALRTLAAPGRARIDTRSRTWLLANELAEVDEENGGYRVTALGVEVADALPRWS
jgi:hypothetical protein